ncbi:MAG: PEP-CTERM sorting domain-containing protein [Planctomycetota bacterium]
MTGPVDRALGGLEKHDSGTTLDFLDVWAAAPDDAWAVGVNALSGPADDPGTSGILNIRHYDGSAWSAAPASAQLMDTLFPVINGFRRNDFDITSVFGNAPDNVYAIASQNNGNGQVIHFDGTQWDLWRNFGSSAPSSLYVAPPDDGADPGNDLFVGGKNFTGSLGQVIQFQDADFTGTGKVAKPFSVPGEPDPATDPIFIPFETGAQPRFNIPLIAGTSPTDVFAVGIEGDVTHYDGTGFEDESTWHSNGLNFGLPIYPTGETPRDLEVFDNGDGTSTILAAYDGQVDFDSGTTVVALRWDGSQPDGRKFSPAGTIGLEDSLLGLGFPSFRDHVLDVTYAGRIAMVPNAVTDGAPGTGIQGVYGITGHKAYLFNPSNGQWEEVVIDGAVQGDVFLNVFALDIDNAFAVGLNGAIFGPGAVESLAYFWRADAVGDNWHRQDGDVTNWVDENTDNRTSPPGAGGDEQVTIDGADVLISSSPASIGTLNATGSLTVQRPLTINNPDGATSAVEGLTLENRLTVNDGRLNVTVESGMALDSGGHVIAVGDATVSFDVAAVTPLKPPTAFEPLHAGPVTGVIVGESGAVTMTLNNGAIVEAPQMHVGLAGGSNGAVTVDGSTSRATVAGELIVGHAGMGAMTLQNAGKATSADGTIGAAAGSNGAVTIDGADSSWILTGVLSVGGAGTGALTLQNQGLLSVPEMILGSEAGGIGTVTLQDTDTTLTISDRLTVGAAGMGTLDLNTGRALTVQTLDLGANPGGDGSMTIDGFDAGGSPFSTLTVTGLTRLGVGGAGVIGLTNGGKMVANHLSLGAEPTGNGTMLIDGPSAALDVSGTLVVGELGAATLTVRDQASLNNANDVTVGRNSGSNGELIFDNATWENTGKTLVVGQSGMGTLRLQRGSRIQHFDAQIGLNTGGEGHVFLEGLGNNWTLDGNLHVGDAGTGRLEITGGAQLSTLDAFIGFQAGSVGSVLVEGQGSELHNTNTGGVFDVGFGGEGELTLRDGGQLLVGFSATIGQQESAKGTVNIDNSTWMIPELLVLGNQGADGYLNVTRGGRVEAGDEIVVGRPTGGPANELPQHGMARVEVDGAGSLLKAPKMRFGNGAVLSELVIRNGGVVETLETVIGVGTPATVTVDGSDTVWRQMEHLKIGELGLGIAHVSGGARVETTLGASIGFGPDGESKVTLTDADTRWSIGEELVIGAGQRGRAEVLNGSRMEVDLDVLVGQSTSGRNSRGTLIIDGAGSELQTPNDLIVASLAPGSVSPPDGFAGGTVSVRGGGTLRTQDGFLGLYADADAYLAVDGAGSVWHNEGVLEVAREGVGQLPIMNGGRVVTNNNGLIAPTPGSRGIVTVEGAGSTWQGFGTLFVGKEFASDGGDATLTVGAGGRVDFLANAELGSGATVNLNGGVLKALSLQADPAATFNWTGGALDLANGANIPLSVPDGGRLGGGGPYDDVHNGGEVNPGASPGVMNVAGDYTQAANATLIIEIEGPAVGAEHDQLAVTGSATLDGALDLRVAESYRPAPFTTFTVLTASSISGGFAEVLGHTLPNDLMLIPDPQPAQIDVVTAIPADFNLSGDVGVPDLIVWAQNFGRPDATFQAGDANLDRQIGIPDLIVWAQNFGKDAGDFAVELVTGASAVAVPEPTVLMIMGLGALSVTGRRRR